MVLQVDQNADFLQQKVLKQVFTGPGSNDFRAGWDGPSGTPKTNLYTKCISWYRWWWWWEKEECSALHPPCISGRAPFRDLLPIQSRPQTIQSRAHHRAIQSRSHQRAEQTIQSTLQITLQSMYRFTTDHTGKHTTEHSSLHCKECTQQNTTEHSSILYRVLQRLWIRAHCRAQQSTSEYRSQHTREARQSTLLPTHRRLHSAHCCPVPIQEASPLLRSQQCAQESI